MGRLTENQAKIHLLKHARALLSSAPNPHRSRWPVGICSALSDAYYYNVAENANFTVAYQNLRKYIKASLGRTMWLEGWQRANKVRSWRAPNGSDRTARLAWIDWMIASLEGKN